MGDAHRDGTREDAAHRRARVLELRRAKKTFTEIGEALGVSAQRAHQLYTEALRSIEFEQVTTYRAAELEKLDALEADVRAVLERRHVVVSHGRVVLSADVVRDEDGDPVYDGDGEPVIRRGAPLVDDGPVLEAADRLLRIADRRARLLGLDTPVKSVVEGTATVKYVVEGIDPSELT